MRLSSWTVVLGAMSLLAFAGDAAAYPQFQFSMGAKRCSLCHFSPTGGGLINDYGRSVNASTISQTEGDPSLLHGLIEEGKVFRWSVDFRVASLVKNQTEDPELLWFPMLGDYYQNIQFGKRVGLYTAIGPRAAARSEGRAPVYERMTAREYYLIYRQKKNRGYYVRGGRYFAPFGLRSQNHTDLVRRYLGFYAYEETLNLSVGNVENKNEWHVTGFMATPELALGNGPRGAGGTAYYEWRPGRGETTALAGQAKVRVSGEDQRYIGGAVAKHWFEAANTLVMAEVDYAVQRFPGDGPARSQLVGYLGATYMPFQGLMASVIAEAYDQDLAVGKDLRTSGSLVLQYFPRSHHEVILIGKVETSGTLGNSSNHTMLQYHYWL